MLIVGKINSFVWIRWLFSTLLDHKIFFWKACCKPCSIFFASSGHFWKAFWFFSRGLYWTFLFLGAAPLYIFMKRDICDICDIFSDIFLGLAIFFHVERYSRYFLSKVDTKRFAFSSLYSSTFPFCAHITRQVKVKNIILMEKCSFCGPTFKEIRVWTKQNSEISRSVSYMYFCIFNRFVVNGSKILFKCTSDDRWDHSLYFANTLSMFPILPVPFNSVSDVIKSNSDRPDKSGKFHPNGAKHCYSRFGWQFCAVWKIWIHHL